ncbi:MAG: hypothetical protein IKJ14_04680 [Clostridia bacterium]|nr:hypothetical protein [Clostridia bacterium]
MKNFSIFLVYSNHLQKLALVVIIFARYIMNNWQIIEPKRFGGITTTENLVNVDDVKIKTTKCFVSLDDLNNFIGDTKREYPFTPCSIAVGQVVELLSESNYIKKGSKVFLAPSQATKNGYLRDFVTIPQSEVYVLPENVSEDDALFLGHVSLAITIIDKLNIDRGNHVAIIGGSYLANVIAQLLMYYQSVPILIDSNEKNLEVAHKTNVYYTLNPNDNLESEILAITGGRKCSKVIYVSDSMEDIDVIDKITADRADVGFTGIPATKTKLSCSFAFEKQLNITFANDGASNIQTAINLLAQKAITLSHFKLHVYKFEYAPKHFENAILKLEENQDAEFIIDML